MPTYGSAAELFLFSAYTNFPQVPANTIYKCMQAAQPGFIIHQTASVVVIFSVFCSPDFSLLGGQTRSCPGGLCENKINRKIATNCVRLIKWPG